MHLNFRVRMALMPHESGTKFYNMVEVIVTKGSNTGGKSEILAHRAYTHWGKQGLIGRVQNLATSQFTKTINTKAGRGYKFDGVTETNHIRCGIAHALVSANVPTGLRKHMAADLEQVLKHAQSDHDEIEEDIEPVPLKAAPKKADPATTIPEWGSW